MGPKHETLPRRKNFCISTITHPSSPYKQDTTVNTPPRSKKKSEPEEIRNMIENSTSPLHPPLPPSFNKNSPSLPLFLLETCCTHFMIMTSTLTTQENTEDKKPKDKKPETKKHQRPKSHTSPQASNPASRTRQETQPSPYVLYEHKACMYRTIVPRGRPERSERGP